MRSARVLVTVQLTRAVLPSSLMRLSNVVSHGTSGSDHCIGRQRTTNSVPSLLESSTFDANPKWSPAWTGFHGKLAHAFAGSLPGTRNGAGPA